MHAAARHGRDAVAAQLLRRHNVDIEARNQDGWTPLHAAASNGHRSTLEFLLSRSAILEAKDESGETPCHKAVRKGRDDVLRCLLERGADPNAANNAGWTPLLTAARFIQRVLVTELLLDFGASIEAVTQDGHTPLRLAVHNQNAKVARLLRERAEVQAQAKAGWTPLHVTACDNGNEKVTELLLLRGSDPNAREVNGGWTPLHLAALFNKNLAVAEMLLKHGADPDARDNNGDSPLHLAASDAMANLLLNQGSKIEATNHVSPRKWW